MKKYLILILFTLITTAGFAQNNYQDVVFLKNGSVIRGLIIEQVPNQSIKIETADKSIFVYKMVEIEKITKEQTNEKANRLKSSSNFKAGYKGIAELGYGIGIGDFGMERLNLSIINGYQINPYFSLGVGTGVRYYTSETSILVPIFADFRTNFIDNDTSPYLSFGVGYTFDATNSFVGVGLLIDPTIGIKFKASDKSTMHVGLGYEMQKMKFYYYDGYLYEFEKNSGAINISVGLSF